MTPKEAGAGRGRRHRRGGGGLQAGRERLDAGREVEQRQLGAGGGGGRRPEHVEGGERGRGGHRLHRGRARGPGPAGLAEQAGEKAGGEKGARPGKFRPRARASRLSRGHVLASLTCQYVATLAVRRRGASARSDRRDSRAPGNKTAGHALYSDSSHAGRKGGRPPQGPPSRLGNARQTRPGRVHSAPRGARVTPAPGGGAAGYAATRPGKEPLTPPRHHRRQRGRPRKKTAATGFPPRPTSEPLERRPPSHASVNTA